MTAPGPISLRISVTDRCRFRCLYCTPAEGVARFDHAQVLRYEEILRLVSLLQAGPGLAKVHLTGGEPLDRRGIATLVAMLAAQTPADLALTTNGQRLGELAGDLKRAGLHRVNISLNTLRPEVYRQITCGGDLAATLAGASEARAAGFTAVKFNTTVLGGLNDDELVALAQFAIDRGSVVRFIELMPLGPGADHYARRFVPAEAILHRLREGFDLTPLPRAPGTSSTPYRATDAAGRDGVVGLIAPCSEPFCGDCNRLRLTADGHLVGCLAKAARVSVLQDLRDAAPGWRERVMAAIEAVRGDKRAGEPISGDRCMAKLGG